MLTAPFLYGELISFRRESRPADICHLERGLANCCHESLRGRTIHAARRLNNNTVYVDKASEWGPLFTSSQHRLRSVYALDLHRI